jgi:hypothetical protein
LFAGAPLPTTFRISPTCTFADDIRSKLKSRYEELKTELNQLEEDGERLYPPQPMNWYPDELAWFMSISKKGLKKTPGLEKFHQYLVAETESGNITRQVVMTVFATVMTISFFALTGSRQHDSTAVFGCRTTSSSVGHVSETICKSLVQRKFCP